MQSNAWALHACKDRRHGPARLRECLRRRPLQLRARRPHRLPRHLPRVRRLRQRPDVRGLRRQVPPRGLAPAAGFVGGGAVLTLHETPPVFSLLPPLSKKKTLSDAFGFVLLFSFVYSPLQNYFSRIPRFFLFIFNFSFPISHK